MSDVFSAIELARGASNKNELKAAAHEVDWAPLRELDFAEVLEFARSHRWASSVLSQALERAHWARGPVTMLEADEYGWRTDIDSEGELERPLEFWSVDVAYWALWVFDAEPHHDVIRAFDWCLDLRESDRSSDSFADEPHPRNLRALETKRRWLEGQASDHEIAVATDMACGTGSYITGPVVDAAAYGVLHSGDLPIPGHGAYVARETAWKLAGGIASLAAKIAKDTYVSGDDKNDMVLGDVWSLTYDRVRREVVAMLDTWSAWHLISHL